MALDKQQAIGRGIFAVKFDAIGNHHRFGPQLGGLGAQRGTRVSRADGRVIWLLAGFASHRAELRPPIATAQYGNAGRGKVAFYRLWIEIGVELPLIGTTAKGGQRQAGEDKQKTHVCDTGAGSKGDILPAFGALPVAWPAQVTRA